MTRLLSLVLLVACACAVEAHAQSGPLAAGTVTVDEPSVTCPGPSGAWVPGMTCAHATITCQSSNGVQPIGLYFGYLTPSSPNGTIVFFTSDDGTTPDGRSPRIAAHDRTVRL